jgi:hypothetical protein
MSLTSTSDLSELTAAEAARRLLQSPEDYATPETLRALASLVSVAPVNGAHADRTVLYSGRIESGDPGLDAWTLARSIQRQDAGVSIIDATERGMFLDSQQFKQAVVRVFAHEGVRDFDDLRRRRETRANQFLYDATQGLWAEASHQFAASASGDVTTLTSQAPEDRTFALVELPALLANPKVKRVNGVMTSVLRTMATGPSGMQGVLKAVAETSRKALNVTSVVRSPEGMIAGVETTALLGPREAQGAPAKSGGRAQTIQAGLPDEAVLAELRQAIRAMQWRWLEQVLGIRRKAKVRR